MFWTEEEYQEYLRGHSGTAAHAGTTPSVTLRVPAPSEGEPEKRRKYGNRRVEVDGKKFDSRHEAEVYAGLMLRRRAGELWLVLRQVPFDLPGGIRYIADFVTIDAAGHVAVIDAKSEATKQNRVYINKKKQMRAEWGVEIKEV